MKLLLDTHVWLWQLLESRRIRPDVLDLLQDGSNEAWLSSVSPWEALLLAERGRLGQLGDPVPWVRRALAALPLRDAPLTREVGLASRILDLPHHDPADRFIGASAQIYDLTLVTADERLLDCDQIPTMSAR